MTNPINLGYIPLRVFRATRWNEEEARDIETKLQGKGYTPRVRVTSSVRGAQVLWVEVPAHQFALATEELAKV